jgi:hypothetical protein
LALELARGRGLDPLTLAELDSQRIDLLRSELFRLKLLGLLGGRLVDQAPAQALPADFVAAVDQMLAFGRQDAVRKQMITWSLCRKLEYAGIPVIPLKGPFLAERLHNDAGVRLSHDVDLLVSVKQIRPALDVLKLDGYVVRRFETRLPRLHYVLEAPDYPELELHWRFSWYESQYAQDVLDRSLFDGDVRRPSAVDEMLMLLLVYARDGMRGLQGAVDVGAWWDKYGASLIPADVQTVLHRHPTLMRPALAAAIAVQSTVGAPVATSVFPQQRADRGMRAALSLADPLDTGSESVRDTAPKVVDAFLTGGHGAPALIGRTVFPRLSGSPRSEPFRRALYAMGFVHRALPMGMRAWRMAADDLGTARGSLSSEGSEAPLTRTGGPG